MKHLFSSRGKFQLEHVSFFLFLFGILCVPLFFLFSFPAHFFLPKQVLFYALVGIIGILLFFGALVQKEWTLRRTLLDIPLLLVLLFAGLSTIFSLSPTQSFWGYNDRFALSFVLLVLLVLWSWYTFQLVQKENRFAVTSLFLALMGLLSAVSVFSTNVLDSFPSGFGMVVAIMGVFSLMHLFVKGNRQVVRQGFFALVVLVSFWCLIQLNFSLVWGIFAFGCALSTMFGLVFWKSIRRSVFFISFVLFGLSLIFASTNVLTAWSQPLPSEIHLGAGLSWEILQSSFVSGPKQMLLGVGPTHFPAVFSAFRPEMLNLDPFFWSVRLDAPYNTLFLWIFEFGFLGSLGFFLLVLLVLGTLLGVFVHLKTQKKEASMSFLGSGEPVYDVKFESLSAMVAFCMATAGLFFSVYHFSLWFLWWTLLGLALVGLSHLQPSLIKERSVTLQVAPQYVFAVSFLFMIFVGLYIGGGMVFGKKLLAEHARASFPEHQSEEQALQQAIARDFSVPKYHLLLGQYYLQQSLHQEDADPVERSQFLARAIDAFSVAKSLAPYRVTVWESLSNAYINGLAFTPSSIRPAFESVQRAKELEPSNPSFSWQLGFLHAWNEDFEEAKKHYQEAVRLKPDYFQAVFDLATISEKEGDVGRAIALYEDFLRVETRNPDIYFLLGRLYFHRQASGDVEKAQILWEQALVLHPQYSDVLYSLGLLFERQGDIPKAREYFERVQTLNPQNTDIQKKLRSLQE